MFVRRDRVALAASALLSLWSVAAGAADWFVAPNGNDAWDTAGTLSEPFKTISRANWEGFAGAGDTIQVRGGTYLLSAGEWIGTGGAPGNPLTVKPYQGEQVILDGSAMSSTVLGVGASHVVIEGFEVRNSARTGITAWGGDAGQAGIQDIVIRNNLVHDCRRGGIYVGHAIAETTAGVQNVLIEGNVIYHTALENAARSATSSWPGALSVTGSQDVVVRNNRVYENLGEGIIAGNARRVQILGNEVYDNYSVNLYVDRGTAIRHEGNLVYSTGNSAYFRQLGGVWLPASGVQIANENETLWADPIWSADNVIVNNVFIGNRNAFHYGNYQGGGGMHGVLFAFNTVYGSVQAALDIDADTHGTSEIANNLWVQTPAPIGGGVQTALDGDLTGISFHHNLWFGGAPQSGAAAPSDLNADPAFIAPGGFAAADYDLLPGSPASGAAVALAAVTQDYAGSARGAFPTLGAYEGIGGAVPLPVANFAAAPVAGSAPLTVVFSDHSSAAATWSWDFGDGATSQEASPSHVYSIPGHYSVTLTVTNDTGSAGATQAGLIRVVDPAARQTVFADGFETGLAGWYREGRVAWYADTPRHDTHAMRFTGNNVWVERSVSTAGFTDIVLSVSLGAASFENWEYLMLYWYDGQQWQSPVSIDNHHPASDGQLHAIEVALPAAAADNPAFRVGFGMWDTDTKDFGYVDDVLVTGVPVQ